MLSDPGNNATGKRMLGALCLFILCGILTLGLWPFHDPKNDVAWIAGENGVRLGRHGTLVSSGAFNRGSQDEDACSLEIWFVPDNIDGTSTLLAFSTPDDPLQFRLRQSDADLVWQCQLRSAQHTTRTSETIVERVFQEGKPAFITITSGNARTAVYLDGSLIKAYPGVRLSARALTGQLVVGTSPLTNDSWSGQLRGLAIHAQELTAAQVLRHYEVWKTTGLPDVSDRERSLATYAFDERSGNVVHDLGPARIDLFIPEKFMILREKFLEPAWREFNLHWTYWKSALINVAGLVPLGYFFVAYLSLARPIQRATLVTIILGATVSLTIEVLQAFLPTRDSGTTDIVTNTLGTALGVMLYRWKPALLAETLSRLPFAAGRRLVGRLS